ncbi:hypothetical protein GCM10027056_06760 [Glaciibacter psychrotolerans]
MRPAFTRVTRILSASVTPRRGKHRARTPLKKSHFALGGGILATCTVVAITAGVFSGNGALEADAAIPAPAATVSVVRPAPIVRGALVTAHGESAGPVTGGTVVTVNGKDLSRVASVKFGDTPGTVTAATADTVTITTPPAKDLATGTVEVELFDLDGRQVKVDAAAQPGAAADSSAAAVGTPTAIAPSEIASPEIAVPDAAVPDAVATPTPAAAPAENAGPGKPAASVPADKPVVPLTFSYTPDPKIEAEAAAAAAAAEQAAAQAAAEAARQAAIATQLDYVLAHWSDYNSEEFGVISGNDCANFASQSLLARGWAMDGEWSYGNGYSAAWASSTALADYFGRHPERATALGADQWDQVKVGDIVQFDWDNSGDRDHTGIVSRVDQTASGVQIYYAGHTNDTDFKSVNESAANTGASVYFWSIA